MPIFAPPRNSANYCTYKHNKQTRCNFPPLLRWWIHMYVQCTYIFHWISCIAVVLLKYSTPSGSWLMMWKFSHLARIDAPRALNGVLANFAGLPGTNTNEWLNGTNFSCQTEVCGARGRWGIWIVWLTEWINEWMYLLKLKTFMKGNPNFAAIQASQYI